MESLFGRVKLINRGIYAPMLITGKMLRKNEVRDSRVFKKNCQAVIAKLDS